MSSLIEVVEPGWPMPPPDSILLRFFTMSSIFVKPITPPAPNGDAGVLCSLKSLDVESETITYGEPSGEASILTIMYSFFISSLHKSAYFTFRSIVPIEYFENHYYLFYPQG